MDAGGKLVADGFSPDGTRLLVMKYVSAAGVVPGVVDVASGKLHPVPGRWRQGQLRRLCLRPDGKAVYISSPTNRCMQTQEFKTLRYHDPASGRFDVLTANIPWDVGGFTIADDGRHPPSPATRILHQQAARAVAA